MPATMEERLKTRRLLIALSVCMILASLPAGAQSQETVTIEGTVVLTDGTPVIKANMEAVSIAGHRNFSVKTKKDGSFRIPFARFGTYTFKVTKDDLLMHTLTVEILDPRKVVLDTREGAIPADQSVPEFEIKPFHGARLEAVLATPAERAEGMGSAVEADAGSLLERANEHFRSGRHEEAGEILEKLLEEHPDDAPAHYLAGLNAIKLGRNEDSLPLLEQANALDPSLPGPASQLAMLANEAGDASAAIDWFEKELIASPEAVPVHINLAILLARSGRNEEAIAKFEEVIAWDPMERGAYQELADLYIRLGDEKKAADTLDNMGAVSEPDPAHWFNVGANLSNKGEHAKAEEAYRKALDIDSTFPEAYRELGYLSVQKGDMGAAREHLEMYLELKPDAEDVGEIQDLVKAIIAQQ